MMAQQQTKTKRKSREEELLHKVLEEKEE